MRDTWIQVNCTAAWFRQDELSSSIYCHWNAAKVYFVLTDKSSVLIYPLKYQSKSSPKKFKAGVPFSAKCVHPQLVKYKRTEWTKEDILHIQGNTFWKLWEYLIASLPITPTTLCSATLKHLPKILADFDNLLAPKTMFPIHDGW